MNAPLPGRHEEFLKECQKFGINTDLNNRWEKGVGHHPKSKQMFDSLEACDWIFGGDYFYWKSGGDGDNGEHLMYEMDIIFELEDAKKAQQP